MKSTTTAALVFAAGILLQGQVPASPTPSPSPTPGASPAPSPGFHFSTSAFATYLDTAANGPGLTPPEGSGFINGSPLAPLTPYDTWSSAPLTPGESGIAQLNLTALYVGSKIDASATLGAGFVTGNLQNAAYWGENLLPTQNPHLGFTTLPYAPSFPTHAGVNDATSAIVSPLVASVGAHDGAWLLRGGFFDLNQTERFVFIQAPLTNATPSIGIATPETLGSGPASLDWWPNAEPGLPLHGVDLTAHRGLASLEVTNAALPSLPGTSVRASIASLEIDHGEGTRYSAQFVHVNSSGDLISTTTMYGADAHTVPGPQGPLPISTLGAQVETIAGLRAAFHVGRADAVAEVGRTWYDANNVLQPGTNAPGGLYHLAVSTKDGQSTYGIDGYRFEARYANAILPYGTPENVWSVAWAWPGVWLKSNYQLVDNLQYPGSNREGYRARYAYDGGRVQVHASYGVFLQIAPATLANVSQTGFVDGFFLPQANNAGTLGDQHQYALWVAWHPTIGDVTLDYVNDVMHRGYAPAQSQDYVSYQAPQAILTLTHKFNGSFLADAGFAHYAMSGSFGQAYHNVDYFQNTFFIGAQFSTSPHGAMLVQLRRGAFVGIPSILNGPSPNSHATTIIVEQRMQ